MTRQPGKEQLLFNSPYSIDEIAGAGKRLVVSAQCYWQSNHLYLLNLDKQEFTPLIRTAFDERGIELHGNRLFFTANYQKLNSVYCYDFTSQQVSRLTQNGWVGNSSYDGVTNQLYFTQLNSYGMSLYQKNAVFQEYILLEAPEAVRPVFTLSDVEIQHGQYRDNLKTLTPKFWYPMVNTDQQEYGFLISGGDAVMDFPFYTAAILNNPKEKAYSGKLDAMINFLIPTIVSWKKELDDETRQYEETKKLTVFLPLRQQTMVGTVISYEDDYQGAEITPFIQVGFKYPRTELVLSASQPRSRLQNDQKRSGFYGKAQLKQYLPQSELAITGSHIDDPDNPDNDLFPEIRGYDAKLDAKQGQVYTMEYSRTLFKIRNGLWNPNIYFEDVSGTLFYDQGLPKVGEKQSSWGIELHLETRAFYRFVDIDWGGRIARNREEKNTYELFVKTVLPHLE